MSDSNSLLSEFPHSSPSEWRKAAEDLLQGKPFEKVLYSLTYEGLTIKPIYNPEDAGLQKNQYIYPGFEPYLRGSSASGYVGNSWLITQELIYPSYEEFNAALRNDLERGQTAIYLKLDRASSKGLDPDQAAAEDVGEGGTSIASLKGFGKALSGIRLENYPIFMDAGWAGPSFTAILCAYLRSKNMTSGSLRGGINFDPLGYALLEGYFPKSPDLLIDDMAALLKWHSESAPSFSTIGINGSYYANAGGNAVQEIAYSVATAVEYIKRLLERDFNIDTILNAIIFYFSVGNNFFLEIAKFRAARLVWSAIVRAFGGRPESGKMKIHARTSRFNKTKTDPYINILRSTTEAFSAVMAGVDSIHVAPFNENFGPADEFSRRIARNVHIILREEAHLDRTIDPGGGSWYIETLSREMAYGIWKLFKDIEKKGGMYSALIAGYPQEDVEKVFLGRIDNISKRKDKLVGTNIFPDAGEKTPAAAKTDRASFHLRRSKNLQELRISSGHAQGIEVMKKLEAILNSESRLPLEQLTDAAFHGATIGEMNKILLKRENAPVEIKPLKQSRGSEDFEKLREASDNWKNKTGRPPLVFMANIGSLKQYKARSEFAQGFFETAGFQAINKEGFSAAEEAAKAALASGAGIIVICSDDDSYPAVVPPFLKIVKTEFRDSVCILAGNPGEHLENFKKAGLDDFIFLGIDAAKTLSDLLKRIGVMS